MTRKYHNYTLQTDPQYREEEPQNNNSHKTPGRQSKATSSLYPIKLVRDKTKVSHGGPSQRQPSGTGQPTDLSFTIGSSLSLRLSP